MDDLARVTVVIPAYKAEATIRRAVDSVLAQPGVEADVVAVVDGRFDRTAELLAAYDPARVRTLVNETNRGPTFTRNRGLAAAKGDYVMFLDCDDFIEGGMLAGLVRAMREAGADLGFGPLQVLKEGKGVRRPVVEWGFRSPADLFERWLALAHTLPPCTTLWRTEFVRRIGGWTEGLKRNEDGELVLRAVMEGARLAQSSEGRGVYVHHDSADRLTSRTDILDSRLTVGELLLARESAVIPPALKTEAVARYFYRVALNCYSVGRDDLAEASLKRSRQLGFAGHGGPWWHRIAAGLLGVKGRYRLTNWLKRRRLFGLRGR